jgi:uncharacterized protein
VPKRGLRSLLAESRLQPPCVVGLSRIDMQFELYKDISKCWRWRLRDDSNHVIATSGDGYRRKSDCVAVLNSIKVNAHHIEIIQMASDNPTGKLRQQNKG